MAQFDKRLMQILVKESILEVEKASQIMEYASSQKRSFNAVAVEDGYVDEKVLIGAVARAVNVPPVDLHKVSVAEGALESLSQDMAEEYGVLPISRIGNVLTMAVANPFNILMLDDVQIITGCDIKPVISSEVAIRKAIARAYNPEEQEMEEIFTSIDDADISLQKQQEEDEELDLSALTGSAEGSPVVKWVNLLIYQAIKNNVSDIHIEPFEKRVSVRYRTDGALYEVTPPPARHFDPLPSPELDNLGEDPYETLDVSERYHERRDRMTTELDRWFESIMNDFRQIAGSRFPHWTYPP